MNKFFQMSHAPATMTFAEKIMLSCAARMVNNGTIVEVGTLHGGSTRLLRDSAKQSTIYSIDINSLRKDTIINEHEAFFYIGNSEKFSNDFPELKVDLLFIDGDHSFNGAFNDYLYLNCLVKNDETIIFHDANYHYYGVRLLVDTLVKNKNVFEFVQVDEMCACLHVKKQIPSAEIFAQTILEHGEGFNNSNFIDKSREETYKIHRPQPYKSALSNFSNKFKHMHKNAKIIGKGIKGLFYQKYFNIEDENVIDSTEANDIYCDYYICSAFYETIHKTLTAKGIFTNKIHVLSDYMFSRIVLDDILNNKGITISSFAKTELEENIIKTWIKEMPPYLAYEFHKNGFLHCFASKFWYQDKY